MALKLSQFPLYTQAETPEEAEQIALSFARMLQRPEIASALSDRGVDPNQLLDAPITAKGITLQREAERRLRKETTLGSSTIGGIQRGAADFLSSFGLDKPVSNLVGIGGEERVSERSPIGTTSSLGPLGQVELPRLLTTIAASFVPLIGAGKGITALQATAKNPLLRSMPARFAGLFGGTEAARQIGRNLAHGDPISVSDIGFETAVGLASGVPFNGTFRRIKSALTPAGVAAAGSMIPGVEFDPVRVGAEALFGGIFPPGVARVVGDATPNVAAGPKAVIDQKELLAQALAKTELAPTKRIHELTTSRIANMSDDQLRELVQAKGTDREILEQMFTNPEGRHYTEFLRARASAIEELSLLSEDTLRGAAKLDGMQGQAAADALAFKLKATRPVEAPTTDVATATPKQLQIAQPSGDRRAFRIQAENAALDAIREKTLPFRLETLAKENATTRAAVESMARAVDDAISGTPRLAGIAAQKDLPKALRPIAAAERTIRPDFETKLRETLFPEQLAKLKDLDSARRAIHRTIGDTTDPKTRQQLEQKFRDLTNTRNSIVDAVNGVLDGKVPPIIKDLAEAEGVVQSMTEGMHPSAVKTFRDNLPTPLRPFEKQLQPLFNKITTSTFRALNPDQRKIQNGIRKLRGEKVLTDPVEMTTFEVRELKGESLRGLQQRFKAMGGTITPVSNGFEVQVQGVTQRVRTLKQATKLADDVGHDRINDVFSLDRAASRRLMSAVHVGDNRWKVVDHAQGTERSVAGLEKAADLVKEVPIRDTAAPELTGVQGLGVPVASSGRRFSESNNRMSVAFREIKAPGGRALPVPPSKATYSGDPIVLQGSAIRNTKEIFLDMEDALGDIRVFSELFDPLSKASNQRKSFVTKPHADLKRALKGVTEARMPAIQDTLLARGNTREALAQSYNLNGVERAAIPKLENWYAELLGINKEGVDELLGAMGKFRASGGDPGRLPGLGDFMLPRTLEALRSGIWKGKVRPGGSHANEVAMSFLHELGNQKFGINDILDNGAKMRNTIKSRMRGADKTTRKSLEIADAELGRFLSIVGDRSDIVGQEMGDAFNKIFTPTLKKLGKLFGDEQSLVQDTKATRGDLEKMASMFASWYSGVAMSMRPALVIRNSTQSLLPSLKIGMKRNIAAIGDAFDKKNWKIARDEGIITDRDGILFADELGTIGDVPGVVGKIPRFAKELQRQGLRPYRSVDAFNRVVSYFGGRRAIMDEAKHIANPEKFLLKTGLASDSKTIQNTVLGLVRQGKLEKAADFYGRHVMQDTQFIYSPENVPALLGGSGGNLAVPGRLFGQFGTWPVSFYNYMRRNTGGVLEPNTLRGRFGLTFLGRYAMMVASLGAIGAAAGIDTSTWNFASPFTFEGGPAFQMLGDASNALSSPSEFQQQIAVSNLKRSFSEMAFPLGGFMGDLEQAGFVNNPITSKEPGANRADVDTEVRQILTAMGFNRGQGNSLSAIFIEDEP